MKKVYFADKKKQRSKKDLFNGLGSLVYLADCRPKIDTPIHSHIVWSCSVISCRKAKIIKSMELHDLGGYRIGNDYFLRPFASSSFIMTDSFRE